MSYKYFMVENTGNFHFSPLHRIGENNPVIISYWDRVEDGWKDYMDSIDSIESLMSKVRNCYNKEATMKWVTEDEVTKYIIELELSR